MRFFYAIAYAYGRSAINNGRRADRIHRFTTLAARTVFIDVQGADADSLTSTDPRTRKALRYAEQGMDWPQAVV